MHPKPHGNRHPHATNGAFETKDGLVMLGASNLRQQRRLWTLLGRPDMIKTTNDERDADHDREIAVLSEIMLTRTADEWEEFLQARHVPAARVRTMGEAIADPQIASRGIIHRHDERARHRGRLRRAARGVQVRAWRPAHRHAAADARPAQRRDPARARAWPLTSRARTRRRPDYSLSDFFGFSSKPRRRFRLHPGALAGQRLHAGLLPVAARPRARAKVSQRSVQSPSV